MSIFVMLLGACFWALTFSVQPYLMKVIINLLNVGKNAQIFWPIVLFLGLYFLETTIFRFYAYFVEIKMFPNMRAKIVSESMNFLMEKSHSFYQNNLAGNLSNKVGDLVKSVPELIDIAIDRFFRDGLALIFAVIALWQANILFAVLMLTWSIVFLAWSIVFSKKLANFSDKLSEIWSQIIGRSVDVLSNILSVRLFSTKEEEKKSLNGELHLAVKAEQKLEWAYFWVWFVYGYSFFILYILTFYLLCKGWKDGWLTAGDFALVLSINIAIVNFLRNVVKDFSQFAKLYGRITQSLRSVLDKTEILDKPNAGILQVTNGQIKFSSVKFKYKDSEPLFQNKSITIEPGQKVGLVGYSGGGKTTFANLILRIYDVTGGKILIDGQDIRDVTQDSLRNNIGMIPQDPSLFHRNFFENIRCGKPNSTDEEVIEAAKKAYAHEFISSLPKGYYSLVGDRGIKLSGGQRQRIAIARAILKNAPILILDEATSQLDSLTEGCIQESLWKLMQGKTTIVIAHRLSTLLFMDRILVFEKGKVIQDGSHAQLLEKGGLYKTLWQSQVHGFLPEKK